MMTGIETAALRLRQSREHGKPCPPVRDLIKHGGIGAAYAVQAINTSERLASGHRIVGRKIGLTASAVQRQLGVDEPDSGILFDDMVFGEASSIGLHDMIQPRVEVEIAFILERDLPHERPTPADLLMAIAYALPALEIVDSRIVGWDISILDTVADNASSGLVVLGGPARRLDGLELRTCAMSMRLNGLQAASGRGADCLGHPLNAATWLAAQMVRLGQPLRAGEIILSGALGPMVPLAPGDHVEALIEGLGSVTAMFTA